MLFIYLFLFSTSWGPIFHEVIATRYADTYLFQLNFQQKNSFILGSIFADGINKTFSHQINEIIREIHLIQDRETNFYWFLMGLICHVTADIFAHCGELHSFIVPVGYFHYFSEFVICSFSRNIEHPKFKRLHQDIIHELQIKQISIIRKFHFIYFSMNYLSMLPFHLFLPMIERGNCHSNNFEMSKCNFMKHFDAILNAIKAVFDRFSCFDLTDLDVHDIANKFIFDIRCCLEDFGFINPNEQLAYFINPEIEIDL
jgi:hypothetical protein